MTPIVKVFMPPREILIPALEAVLYSGMVGEGEHVYSFEDKFKSMFNIGNGFAVVNKRGSENRDEITPEGFQNNAAACALTARLYVGTRGKSAKQ